MKRNTSTVFSIKNSPLPTAIVRSNGELLEFSNALASLLVCAEGAISSTLILFFDSILKAFKGKLLGDNQFTLKEKITITSGKPLYLRIKAYPFYYKDDKLFQIYFDDISEEEAIKDLVSVANVIAKIGVWTYNMLTHNLVWCSLTREIYGVSDNYIPNLEDALNFYKEGSHRDQLFALISECMETGKEYDEEFIIVMPTGEEKWVRAIGQAIIVKDKVVELRGVLQDIDKQKTEQLSLDIVSQRMRIANDSTGIGIWDYDLISGDVIWNKKMFELFDIEERNIVSNYKEAVRKIHPEDIERINKEVDRCITEIQPYSVEYRIINKKGEIVYIKSVGKVLCDKRGKPYRMVGVKMDMTKEVLNDIKLKKLLEVTEKQNHKLLEFTNIVSHNLRSNSSNISMLSTMLNNEDLSDEQQKQFAEMIKTSAENLDETIVQLNEVTKVRSTKKSQFKSTPIKECIDKVVQGINILIKNSNAEITINVDNTIEVWAVKPYFESIILNLLINSIKYKDPKKSPQIKIDVKVLAKKIILSFSDNGLGIDLNKNRDKIFGMYKTFHNNEDAKGVGLFLTKNQMQAMGGDIDITSEVGKGTTFQLHFLKPK